MKRLCLLGALLPAIAAASANAAVITGGGIPDAAHASLELWLDAGTLASTTTSVSNWANLAAKPGRDATQLSVGARPTYVASNAAFAGHSTVRFDGGDFLTSANGATMGIAGNSARTVFFVFSKENGHQSSNILGYGRNRSNQVFDVGLVSNERIYGHFYGTPWLAGSPTFALNQMTVGSVSHDGATFRTTKRDVDGSGGASVNRALNTDGGGNLRIGRGIYGPYNNFRGDIAEILVYSDKLSQADFAAVEDYLFNKYTTAPAVAPEPSSLLTIAGLGCAALGACRRKRNARN